MIRHVIMWKFNAGEAENMQKFLAGLQALDGVIPEILRMEIGVNCKEGNNFDACLIADFEDLDALERYKHDPRHGPSRSFASPSVRPGALWILRFNGLRLPVI